MVSFLLSPALGEFLPCVNRITEGRLADQQMGQLYELMQAIRKHTSEEGEGEA